MGKILCFFGLHKWTDSFEDRIYMSNFSPEHYTVDVNICIRCGKRDYIRSPNHDQF